MAKTNYYVCFVYKLAPNQPIWEWGSQVLSKEGEGVESANDMLGMTAHLMSQIRQGFQRETGIIDGINPIVTIVNVIKLDTVTDIVIEGE